VKMSVVLSLVSALPHDSFTRAPALAPPMRPPAPLRRPARGPCLARASGVASRDAPVAAPLPPAPPSQQPDGPTLCSSLRAPPAPASSPDRALLQPADPLPPTAGRPTALACVVPGRLWTLTQPFTPSPISALSAENRMSVVLVEAEAEGEEGGNGGGASPSRSPCLALINPVTPTPELLAGLEAIGAEVAAATGGPPPPVSHILIPSTSPEHWSGAASLATAFPGARIWAPPGFFSNGPGGGRIGGKLPGLAELSAVLDAAAAGDDGTRPRAAEIAFPPGRAEASLLGGAVRAALFAGRGGFTEVAFYVPAARTVFTADTAFGLNTADLAATPGANWLDGLLARVAGIHARLGCATWFVLKASGEAAREYVGVIDGWRENGGGVDWVVPAHLSAPWPGGALDGAFAFVREEGQK
jgi:glyoxylase-like metal-dependent hydrolase (beta-lactamase superfamily II)